MLRKAAVFCIIFISAFNCYSQDTKTYIVNPGQTIQEVIPDSVRYSYSTYQSGTVHFTKDELATSLFNYNLMLGEMQFINPKGDTLSIGDADKFTFISIGSDTFYFKNGYLKQLASRNNVKLLQKQTIRLASRNTMGAFDQPAQGAASTYSSFIGNTHDVTLHINEKLTFKKETNYYLMDKYQSVYPLSLNNLELLFPKQRTKIATTFQGKKIHDPEVIKELVQFINNIE